MFSSGGSKSFMTDFNLISNQGHFLFNYDTTDVHISQIKLSTKKDFDAKHQKRSSPVAFKWFEGFSDLIILTARYKHSYM